MDVSITIWVVLRIIFVISVTSAAIYYWIKNYTSPVQALISGTILSLIVLFTIHAIAPTEQFMQTVTRSQCAKVQLGEGGKSGRGGPKGGTDKWTVDLQKKAKKKKTRSGQSAVRQETKIFAGLANDPNRRKKVWHARIEDYPWVVAIGEHAWPRSWFTKYIFGRAANQVPITQCTGVVLNENWVLTGQHCKQWKASTMYITAGTDCRPERGGILEPNTQVRYAVREVDVVVGREPNFWEPKLPRGQVDHFTRSWAQWWLDLFVFRPVRFVIRSFLFDLIKDFIVSKCGPLINNFLWLCGVIDFITGQRLVALTNSMNIGKQDLLLLKLNAPLDLLPYDEYFMQEPMSSPDKYLISRSGRPTVIGLADHMHDADFMPESGRDWLAFAGWGSYNTTSHLPTRLLATQIKTWDSPTSPNQPPPRGLSPNQGFPDLWAWTIRWICLPPTGPKLAWCRIRPQPADRGNLWTGMECPSDSGGPWVSLKRDAGPPYKLRPTLLGIVSIKVNRGPGLPMCGEGILNVATLVGPRKREILSIIRS